MMRVTNGGVAGVGVLAVHERPDRDRPLTLNRD